MYNQKYRMKNNKIKLYLPLLVASNTATSLKE